MAATPPDQMQDLRDVARALKSIRLGLTLIDAVIELPAGQVDSVGRILRDLRDIVEGAIASVEVR